MNGEGSSFQHRDRTRLYLPHPISGTASSGMPLKCQSGGRKHCLSAAAPPRGGWVGGALNNKVSALISLLLTFPAHLPIKHRRKTLTRPSFLDFTASPHAITHDHTISVGFYDREESAGARTRGGRGRG